MDRNDDRVRVFDMLQACDRIMEYTGGGEAAFMASPLRQDAVFMNLAIMGEAAGKLSAASRQALDDVPWRTIIGMRNVLIHEYGGIDLEIIWRVIEKDIPVLQDRLRTLSLD